ncbi:MAG TPA: ATP-binding protein [Gemmatimonadaceae bacterium]|nr:ATP-binding protein [Gemmatimonadaceae bacterium]
MSESSLPPIPGTLPEPPAEPRASGESREDRYRLLAGATSDVLWDWDLATDRVERNEAVYSTFGYAPDAVEPTREWWHDRTHPDDRGATEAVVQDALARLSAFSLEYRFKRADGSYATVFDRAWIMRDAAGHAMRAVGSCGDVSERKALEFELRAKTERLAAMMDMQREIASASFNEPNALSRVAERAARLTHADGAMIARLDRGELANVGAFRIGYATDEANITLAPEIARDAVRTREPVVVWDVEHDSRIDPAGTKVENVGALVAVPLIAENRVIGVLWVHSRSPQVFGTDAVQALSLVAGVIAVAMANADRFSENQRLLAQRTSALASARESEERYRMVADGTLIQILFIDTMERCTFANKAVAGMLGRAPELLVGQHLRDIAGQVNYDRIRAHVIAALTGREQQFDVEWESAKSERRVLAMRYVPRRDDAGVITGFFVISEDETERRELQEQVQRTQRMEAVGQLAGGVAHDFNNLLTVIGGFAQMLRADPSLNNDQRSDVDEIHKATQRASSLTRQLLAFSRKQTMQPAPVDLNAVVRDNERMLRRLVREDLTLECNLAPSLGTVFADSRQIEHVLVNLVVNARDATGEGGRITIDTADVEIQPGRANPVTPGAWVRLRVSDTGVGMTSETMQHVFEPFFTTKPAGEGTGLGLAMAYGIIEQSGGAIYAESEPGRGTVFTVLLPRADEPTHPRKTPVHTAAIGARGERVLLVEDEEPVRALARRVLERAGYVVALAKNGREALGLVQAEPKGFALIVSDVVMPEMGGLELAERVRDIDPDLPVLLMSGYAATEIERRGGVPEGARFLQKPFGPDALLSAVRQAHSPE